LFIDRFVIVQQFGCSDWCENEMTTHGSRRDYARITIWGALAPFLVILFITFVMQPFVFSGPSTAYLGSELGKYFVVYLILLVATLAMREYLASRNEH
jgi:hypothetical protein